MSAISLISLPEIDFAHDYRMHVLPTLATLMPSSACMIALGRAGFAEEYDSILRCAWHLGGWFLQDALWFDLEDWVSDKLLAEIDAIEAEIGAFEEDEPPDYEQVWAIYESLGQREVADAS